MPKCFVSSSTMAFSVMSHYKQDLHEVAISFFDSEVIPLRNQMVCIAQIARSLIAGVVHCHSKGLIVKDVKLENALERDKKNNGELVTEYVLCDLSDAIHLDKIADEETLRKGPLSMNYFLCTEVQKLFSPHTSLAEKIEVRKRTNITAVAISLLKMIDNANIQYVQDNPEEYVKKLIPITKSMKAALEMPAALYRGLNKMIECTDVKDSPQEWEPFMNALEIELNTSEL